MIEVTRKDGDLSRQVWRFTVIHSYSCEAQIRMDSYSIQNRPTKRHKFKTTLSWDSFGWRRNYASIKPDEVPEPEDVIAEALSMVKPTYKPIEKSSSS